MAFERLACGGSSSAAWQGDDNVHMLAVALLTVSGKSAVCGVQERKEGFMTRPVDSDLRAMESLKRRDSKAVIEMTLRRSFRTGLMTLSSCRPPVQSSGGRLANVGTAERGRAQLRV